jgi:transposase
VLSKTDRLEAMRRFKHKKTKSHERLRYHALLLVTDGYSFQQTAAVLFVDPESVSRWVSIYQRDGLDGLNNNPLWGGQRGQRLLTQQQLTRLGTLLDEEAMPGTEVGSGWSVRAIIELVQERFNRSYSQRGIRKLLRALDFSCQRGRPFYNRRTVEHQGRFERETLEVLEEFATSGQRMIALAGDQTRVYLEGTVGKRWSRRGQQPKVPQASRSKYAENIYGAVHLGTGQEVSPFSIDFQDADATICWFEMVLAQNPRGRVVVWLDSAPHLVDEEVEEWLEAQGRIRVIRFAHYTPEENPKEGTWKALKEETSAHRWHPRKESLSEAIDGFYQSVKRHTVNFLQRFGYVWKQGRIYPLSQST